MEKSKSAVLRSFVKAQKSDALHGLAWKLNHEAKQRDLSPRQEWLWQLAVRELELRRRLALPGEQACPCELCVSPFEEPEQLEAF
jgi:hypothetical protein